MNLNLLVLKTQNIKQLAEFYSFLGLNFQYHKHGNGVFRYSAQIDKMIFEIYPLGKNDVQPEIMIRLGFEIEDLDRKIEELVNNNGSIVSFPQKTNYGYMAIIEDPDKRKIELLQTEN